jgi:hypothetical protein
MIAVGAIGYVVSRAWSIIDAATGPSSHNARVRALKMRLGMPLEASRIMPYVAPLRDRGGASAGGTAGLTFRF